MEEKQPMNINNIWLDNHHGLHRQYSGNLSIADILKVTLELHDSPQFKSLQYVIEDYTNTTSTPFGANDIELFSNVVRLRSRTKEDLKVAIISRDSPESIATANNFREQMQQCHYQCEVFLSLAEAIAWAADSLIDE